MIFFDNLQWFSLGFRLKKGTSGEVRSRAMFSFDVIGRCWVSKKTEMPKKMAKSKRDDFDLILAKITMKYQSSDFWHENSKFHVYYQHQSRKRKCQKKMQNRKGLILTLFYPNCNEISIIRFLARKFKVSCVLLASVSWCRAMPAGRVSLTTDCVASHTYAAAEQWAAVRNSEMRS